VSGAATVPAPAPPGAPEAVREEVPWRRHEPPPGEPRRVGYLYLLPAFIAYFAFALLPLLHTGWLSFFDWDGITEGTWIGLGNYRDLVEDAQIRTAFLHSLVFVLFYSVLPIAFGLLLAASLSRMRVYGISAFRALLFLPQVIAMVVVAVIWRWIYAPDGPLNQGLGAAGLDSAERAWLGDFTWALPSVGLAATWVMYGLCMVLFIAGVQKIPTSLYDAARVDGAGPVREFFAVTLPGLRNEIVVAAVLTMIAALRNFDLVFVTTAGGPGDATKVPSLELYMRAFQVGQVGSAAAIGISLALVIFAVTFVITRFGERRAT
jgi:raffinose/stachyose/melibiose transport system permease protein